MELILKLCSPVTVGNVLEFTKNLDGGLPIWTSNILMRNAINELQNGGLFDFSMTDSFILPTNGRKGIEIVEFSGASTGKGATLSDFRNFIKTKKIAADALIGRKENNGRTYFDFNEGVIVGCGAVILV